MDNLYYQEFRDIDINDPFFDSLKQTYTEFSFWFARKANEKAYVLYADSRIVGFMYLKVEQGPIHDIHPQISTKLALKIGTFKFENIGTRRGQRFLKKAIDNALFSNVDTIYVTMFEEQKKLMGMIQRYGFQIHGRKNTANGTEVVLTKFMNSSTGSSIQTYPFISLSNKQYLMLSIYPEHHTKLFPDSILKNENEDIVQDVSHTNSIHKIYMTKMDAVNRLNPGDLILIYRTTDNLGPAEYRSVVTSLCVFQSIRHIDTFESYDEYYDYCSSYSVFTDEELLDIWNTRKYPFIIKFMYNAALTKRLTKAQLVANVGLSRGDYWGYRRLTLEQIRTVIYLGGVNESLIVN
ncbi:hypothetical protein [Alteromonas sp. a30]|uniref:hypothetical protein n=1 Tax=Alteromonas sp. a30 TaxID=2730917 RepID=UPI0022816BC1|nr:hypothetical protein [Alteromonas sp. a30]MCY7296129.1 N-acetyltransferase [Alteromonas sp. a30]